MSAAFDVDFDFDGPGSATASTAPQVPPNQFRLPIENWPVGVNECNGMFQQPSGPARDSVGSQGFRPRIGISP